MYGPQISLDDLCCLPRALLGLYLAFVQRAESKHIPAAHTFDPLNPKPKSYDRRV